MRLHTKMAERQSDAVPTLRQGRIRHALYPASEDAKQTETPGRQVWRGTCGISPRKVTISLREHVYPGEKKVAQVHRTQDP